MAVRTRLDSFGRGSWFRGAAESAVGVALLAFASGCACEDVVEDAPLDTAAAVSVQCTCVVEGRSQSGELKQQAQVNPVVCVPEAARANPAAYCGSSEVQDFVRVNSQGLLDLELPGSCSLADLEVTCSASPGPGAVLLAPSCEGACPAQRCDGSACSETELLSGSCACTQGSACGEVTAPVCAPSFEGSWGAPPALPLPDGHGSTARELLFGMEGGWLPGSEFAVSLDFDDCSSGTGCQHLSEDVVTPVSGTFELLGSACPFASCNLGFHSRASLADFEMDLGSVHAFTEVTMDVLSRRGALPISAAGFGFIQPGDLVMTASGKDNGVAKVIASQVNDFPVLVMVDWTTNHLTIPSLGLSFPGGEGSITVQLEGTFAGSLASTLDPSLYPVEEADGDGDSVPDSIDNCPLVANPLQELVPSPVLVASATSSACALTSLPVPMAEDICFGGTVTVTSDLSGTLPLGHSLVTWTATDERGRSTTLSQPVVNHAALTASLIHINDRARIEGGSIAALGTRLARIGTDVSLVSLFSNSSLEIRDRTRILGELVSAGNIRLGSQVSVGAGRLHPFTTPALGSFPDLEVPSFQVGTTSVSLEPGQARSVAPGRYRSLRAASRARLTLAAGDYYLDSLTLEPDARVLLTADTRLFVRTSLVLRGTFQGAPFVHVTYTGTSPVTLDRNFTGMLRAPRAKVALGSGNQLTFTGRFYAAELEVNPGAKVICSAAEAP